VPSRRIRLGTRVVDLANREVVSALDGSQLSTLTELEASLLAFLLDQNGELVSKDDLLTSVWGYAPGVRSRAVDYTVRRLRKKLETLPARPVHLVGVYGGGLALRQVQRLGRPDAGHKGPCTPPRPPRDTFVGRATQLDRLGTWLDDGAHLVTILGPGGIGKTRLALELLRTRSTAQAVWVDLSSVQDAPGVHRAIAGAAGRDDADANAALDKWNGWWVLDEAEGCRDALVPLLDDWLEAMPHLRVLVTSRTLLGVPGELPLRLDALDPDAALRLYNARSAAAGSLHDPDDPALTALVERLDGIPLSIELLAARAGVRTVEELTQGLDRPLAMLAGPHTEGRSLRSVMAWSWRLLSPDEVWVLDRCAIFPGLFGRAAAEAVAGADAVRHLDALRNHSLVRAEAGAQRRFSMSMGARAMGRERLDQGASGGRAQVEEAVLAWALTRTGDTGDTEFGSGQPWIDCELALLRELLQGLQRHGAAGAEDLALVLAVPLNDRGLADEVLGILRESSGHNPAAATALARLLGMRGELKEAQRVLADALGSNDGRLRGQALLESGDLHLMAGEPALAEADLQAAMQLLRQAGAQRALARATDRASVCARLHHNDPHEAVARSEAAVELWRSLNSPVGVANAQVNRAMAFRGMGRLHDALAILEDCLATFARLGRHRRVATIHVNLGVVNLEIGDRRLAARHFADGLELHEAVGHSRGAAYARLNLATVHWLDGDSTQAEQALSAATRIAHELAAPRLAAMAEGTRGVGRFIEGRPEMALHHLRSARTRLDRLSHHSGAAGFATFEGAIAGVKGEASSGLAERASAPALVAAGVALGEGRKRAAREHLNNVPVSILRDESFARLHGWLTGLLDGVPQR